MKNIFVILVVGLLVAFSAEASQGPRPRPTERTGPNPREIRQETRELRNGVRTGAQGGGSGDDGVRRNVEEVRNRIQNAATENAKERERKEREDRARREGIRPNDNRTITDSTAAAAREKKISDQREKLEERLAKVRDMRKKEVIRRAAEELNRLNERWTKHLSNVVEQLRGVLRRIVTRTEKARAQGLNVEPVLTEIEQAEKAIKNAEEAIRAQAAKTHDITFVTEAELRKATQEARSALFSALRSIRDLVVAARDAVHQAAVTLAQIHGERPSRSGTPAPSGSPAASPTPTPTLTPTPAPTAN